MTYEEVTTQFLKQLDRWIPDKSFCDPDQSARCCTCCLEDAGRSSESQAFHSAGQGARNQKYCLAPVLAIVEYSFDSTPARESRKLPRPPHFARPRTAIRVAIGRPHAGESAPSDVCGAATCCANRRPGLTARNGAARF